jgi:lycopene cyclase domain-containing protein
VGDFWDFGRWSYVAVLIFVILGSIWLEVFLRTRVLRRPKRLLLAIVPVLLPFLIWDAYAISQGHWYFTESRILGVYLPAGIPLDELLFFIVIPFASILTLEAVRSFKGTQSPRWRVGDEVQ